ncbi:MAG: TIGR00341 family protein [Leptolyngbya sp. SIO4C1]|nr:TIGR00341 family protein [Leptolyngbya sp. SIO4C1]
MTANKSIKKPPKAPKRRSLLALLRHRFPEKFHRPLIRNWRRLRSAWQINSGEWKWLEGKPMPLSVLNRSLWRSANPSSSYYALLFLSGVISVLGLLAGSTATIIGAMIVAPLMGPITGIAFAMSIGNRRLLKRAGLALLTGCLMTVGSAYLFTTLLGLNTLNEEITSRIRPTLLDLVIALAAGAAGSYAKTRRDVADALPGVAIAVALVPPLSVIGIGLSLADTDVALGSTLLFLTNLAGIILSGGIVFIWQEYGSLSRAKNGLLVAAITLSGLGIPLGFSLRELVIEERARSAVSSLIRDRTPFGGTDIRRLRIDSDDGGLLVQLEVAAPRDSISAEQVRLVHQLLQQELDRPIDFRVRILPIQAYDISSE